MTNHTWLGITNETQENVYFLDYELRPLETMTISIWPDTSGYKSLGGVYINREPAEYRGGKECTTYSMGKFPSGRRSRMYSPYVINDEEVSEEDFNSRKEKWNQISSHFVTISYDLMTDITDMNIEILLNADYQTS